MPATKNIDYMMAMTYQFITGEMDLISYDLDFPYELELRFKAMRREHRLWAELIYERLYEDGNVKRHTLNLSDKAFEKRIKKHYQDILRIVKEGFL